MAERKPAEAAINWAVVMFGGMLLALAIVAVPDPFLRVLAGLFVFVTVIYLSQSKVEPEVENPLLDQTRPESAGLDRRKYGRLRSSTDRLLDQVRDMNRIAVEGREGKVAPRHAHAELDRLAAGMRDMIDEIRKSAGIPTPVDDTPDSSASQPQIVMPKTAGDDSDKMLDALEAQALAEKERVADQRENEEDDSRRR